MKKVERLNILDSLRGVASVVVVLYHFVTTTINYIENDTVITIFEFGDKGVQLFFIISGIVIPLSMINGSYKYSSFFNFLLKRLARIEPPYILSIIIGIFYLIARNYIPGTVSVDITPTVFDTVLHLGYLVPLVDGAKWINPVYWTLAIEFQYYLFMALTFPLLSSKNIYYRSIFYLLMLVLPFLDLQSSMFPHWTPLFLSGIIYVVYKSEHIVKSEFLIVFVLSLIFVQYHLGTIDMFLALISIILIEKFADFKNRIGMFFGKISYSLYLIHSIVGAGFINLMSHYYRTPLEKFIVISIGFILSVISASIMYLIIEKPSIKFSKNIRYNN